jgi:hypothetical protein
MQPAALGAAVQAAKIHLSDEIEQMQEELRDRIRFTKILLKKYGLPVVADSEAAIFFIGAGLPKTGYNIVKRMLNEGYYVNLGIFPGVPLKNTGVRFTITRLHSFEQIGQMVRTLARVYPLALAEERVSAEEVYKAFQLKPPEEQALDTAVHTLISQSLALRVQHAASITGINPGEWNHLFGHEGNFDWHALHQLEQVFTGNPDPEHNWCFDYFIIRSNDDQPVVAGFVTTTHWKDDMLSPAAVSQQAELRRMQDPYYLTSRLVSTGSPITQGRHLYINRQSPLWKEALQLFLEQLSHLQEQYGAQGILLRDFAAQETDSLFESFLVDNGFFRITMPDNFVMKQMDQWHTEAGYYQQLSRRSRRHFRQDVLRHRNRYRTDKAEQATPEAVAHWYQLYLNVKARSLTLNTFTLPLRFFRAIAADPHWDVLELRLDAGEGMMEAPVAVMLSYRFNTQYYLMIIGMDYNWQKDYKVYKQALFQVVMRARQLGCTTVVMGFTAGMEKKKAGAGAVPTFAYLQTKDNYNLQVLDAIPAVFQQHRSS